MRWKNEAVLVTAIVKVIKQNYPEAFIMKVHGGPMQQPGVPDLLLCIKGMFIGLEVKHQKPNETEHHARERTTTLQLVQILRINLSGGIAATVLTPEEAMDIIRQALSTEGDSHA